MINFTQFSSTDEYCRHGIKYQSRCFVCDATPKVEPAIMKKQTHYVVIEVAHHGDEKRISELIAQAAYSLSSVDDARVLAVGVAVLRPECVE